MISRSQFPGRNLPPKDPARSCSRKMHLEAKSVRSSLSAGRAWSAPSREAAGGWMTLSQAEWPQIISPERVAVHGAITGFVSQAAVQGALLEIAYGEQGRRWKNCWMMAPSGVLRGGDSGSAVFTTGNAGFLGMYVGGSELVESGKALF